MSETITLNKGQITFTRPGLKKWLDLEDIKQELKGAVDPWNSDAIAKAICSYVSTALSQNEEKVYNSSWMEVAKAFYTINNVCSLEYDFPFLRIELDNKKETWDYTGRTWYIWLHMLAKEFGWKAEDIETIDVDMAFALAQEIAVNNQLEKEFLWATSEVPYQSKQGFKPLERPRWMLFNPETLEVKTTTIRKEFMPVGKIVKYGDESS